MSGSHSVYGAEMIARIPATVTEGFAPALAQALRDGVLVEKIDGVSVWIESRMVVTDTTEDQLIVLRKKLEQHQVAHANFMEQIAEAKPEAKREKAGYAEEARKVLSKIESFERQIAELEDERAQKTAAPATFETDAQFVLAAVKAISEHRGRMPREVVDDIKKVMPEPQIRIHADSRIEAEVTTRLPVDGKVAEVGPIRWVPDDQPELNVGLAWAAREAAGEPAPWLTQPQPPRQPLPRRHTKSGSAQVAYRGERTRLAIERALLLDRLEQIGATREGALTLVACPFPAAVHVVLAVGEKTAMPSWAGPQWVDPDWAQWLYAAYAGSPAACTSRGHWSNPSWSRQLIIDTAEKRGGQLTFAVLEQAAAANGIKREAITRLVKGDGPLDAGIRRWHPPTRQWGYWPGRGESLSPVDYGVELVRCEVCDAPPSIATRVTEILGDTLCASNHMIGATRSLELEFDKKEHQFPDPAKVTVPDEYRWLRYPPRMYEWRRLRNRDRSKSDVEATSEPKRGYTKYRQAGSLTAQERAELVRRYVQDELSVAAVADEFNLGRATAQRLLQAEGVTRSYRGSQSRAGKPRQKKQ